MYIHLNIYMYIYTHACIYTHIYIYSCTCRCVYVYVSRLLFWDRDATNLTTCKLPWYICLYLNMMYISMFTSSLNNIDPNPSCHSLALIYVYMYICIFTYIHICVCICNYFCHLWRETPRIRVDEALPWLQSETFWSLLPFCRQHWSRPATC